MAIFSICNWQLDETIPNPIQWPEFSVELEVPTTRPHTLVQFHVHMNLVFLSIKALE